MSVCFRGLVVVSAAAALVVGLAACDRTSTSPRLTGPAPGPGAPPGSPVTVVRLELVAPSEIAPDESVQLTLNAIKSDGSVENVSAQAIWTSATQQVLTLTPTGVATGRTPGESLVSARHSNRAVNRQFMVLPKGTFRLRGVAAEDGSGGLGIENVTVTVISGVGEGMTASTRFDGTYTLYGVAGAVRLHAKKEGYFNALQEVNVTQHSTHNFSMTSERPRERYDGSYTLTISAATPCGFTSGGFPDAARRRVYTANVRQDGTRITVTLGDADFVQTAGHGAGFTGILQGTETIQFAIGSAYYYYYYSHGYFDVIERFGNGTFVVGNGTATLRGTPSRLSGNFNGALATSSRLAAPFWPFSATCYAPAHGMEMVRR